MGDYVNSFEAVMSGDDSTLFGRFKHHLSGKASHTHLVLLESLKDLHPGRAITWGGSSPIKFARAGFAEAKLITEGNNFIHSLSYTPAENRLNGEEGRVWENISVGTYEFTFEGVTSLVYRTMWPLPNGCTQDAVFYVAPEDDVNPEDPHAWAKSIIKAAGKWHAELHEEIYIFDNGSWRKNSHLWKSVQSASWDDVILDPTMKETLIKDVDGFFDSRAIYEEYAVPWKRGIIVHGTPGCGKTISIKALMKSIQGRGAVSLYVKSFSTDQGRCSSQAIRSIFTHARRMAPCMLIFEDLDSLVIEEVRSYFLNEVDGLESNHGILMIGSTNHLDRLDAGISKRPSRFDRKYHYKLPGERERILYCEYWRDKLQNNNKLDFDTDVCKLVAQLTEGFSFAYMKELFVQTLLAIVSGRTAGSDVAITDTADNTTIGADSARLVRKDERTATGESAEKKTEAGGVAAKERQPRQRKMPQVDIPVHLQSNPLVRVLRRQIKALWKDMDNTTSEINIRPKVTMDEDSDDEYDSEYSSSSE